MLHSIKEMTNLVTMGTDGELGTIQELYFDDVHWTIRYLVLDTGGWSTGRTVLIPANALRTVDWANETIQVGLNRRQIDDSPEIDSAIPVSRRHEFALHNHYGYPYYWAGPYVWGYSAYPTILADKAAQYARSGVIGEQIREEQEQGDSHLRSSRETIGYDIQATDGRVGHVEDFLFDDRDWSIRLMVVDTHDWWPEKDVLISPKRIDHVDWQEQRIVVNITRHEVESSREFDPAYPPPVGPQYEIYRRFGMPPR